MSKAKVWRLNVKTSPCDGISRKDVFEFCQKNSILGIGWGGVETTDDYWELKNEVVKVYPGDKGALKGINAIKQMEVNDLIYTRFEAKYYICQVKRKWVDRAPIEGSDCYDIYNYVHVDWAELGTEANVPGKVINSFGPSATVQRVSCVEPISKLLWNDFTQSEFKYPTTPITIDDFWQSLSSEDLECLVLLYLQSKGYYIYSTTLKRSTAKIECEMVKSDGSHRCFPQVKREVTLQGQNYEDLLEHQDDKVYLFTTSQNYEKSNNSQIEYLRKDELEGFIRKNKKLLPAPVLNWVKICNEF